MLWLNICFNNMVLFQMFASIWFYSKCLRKMELWGNFQTTINVTQNEWKLINFFRSEYLSLLTKWISQNRWKCFIIILGCNCLIKYSILYYTSCATKALSIAIRLNFTISGHLNKNFKVHSVTVLVNFSPTSMRNHSSILTN